MRKLLQRIFQKVVTRFAQKVSSSPRKEDVCASLSQLLQDIADKKEEKGPVIPFDSNTGKFIIFSDQHKGGGDLADDFHPAESNYLADENHLPGHLPPRAGRRK